MEPIYLSKILLIMFCSYLLGSIPFGLILGKFASIGDIRKHGSGNIGATNAYRIGGIKLGTATLILDAAKAIVPVYFTMQFFSAEIAAMAGFMSSIGHIFTVWLKFNGGKGVATTLAAFCTLDLTIGLLGVFVWITAFCITRISAVASLISISSITIIAGILLPLPVMLISLILTIIIFYRHKQNIIDLLNSKKNKV